MPAFAANFDLTSLDGTNGFRLVGPAFSITLYDIEARYGGRFGFSVSSAGDINGDGFDDLIIGAPFSRLPFVSSGAAYVVYGQAGGFAPSFDVVDLDGSTGFQLRSGLFQATDGYSVASAGDVNGDGLDDIMIGSSGSGGRSVYVVFGSTTEFSPDFNLTTLNGSTGFRIKLSGTDPDTLGRSVSSAGDVNGDGFDDLLVSADFADFSGTGSGVAYVIFGKSGGFTATVDPSALTGSDGFSIGGGAAGDRLGFAVATVGDINGDGFDDVAIGAPEADSNGARSGTVHVVFGHTGSFAANIDISSLDGTDGFQVKGASAGDNLGMGVASAGDVNGDGFDDLILSAPGAQPNGTYSGAAYVIFGNAGGFSADLDLSTLNGTNGFKMSGAAAGERLGSSVSSAGDINGDGFGDLIIGSNGVDAYVIFGKAAGFSANFDLSALDGSNGFKIDGEEPSGTGIAVSSAGDVNGDGFDDIMVGAPYLPVGDASAVGASYVIFGHATGVINRSGTSGNDILSGGEFNDVLRGLGSNDWLRGNDGNDTLKGGAGADEISGGAGLDFLLGDGGNDLIDGGEGNDRIIGGNGKDVLTGNDGSDRFIFTALAESRPGALASDEITDFTVVAGTGSAFIDRIDLSAIDAKDGEAGHQAFSFIGTAGFTGEGQIRATQDGADTKLVINTQGSNGAEMTIVLKDFTATSLTAADFIL